VPLKITVSVSLSIIPNAVSVKQPLSILPLFTIRYVSRVQSILLKRTGWFWALSTELTLFTAIMCGKDHSGPELSDPAASTIKPRQQIKAIAAARNILTLRNILMTIALTSLLAKHKRPLI
jgi:hypothetical protein